MDDPIMQRVILLNLMVEKLTPKVIDTCERLTREALERTGLTIDVWRSMTFDERERALKKSRRSRT